MNACIVGQTKMWCDLSDLDLDDHYAQKPTGDWRPMRNIVAFLRQQTYSRHLSAFTSHYTLVVTPAIGHTDYLRSKKVRIDFHPSKRTFDVEHRDVFGELLDRATCTEENVVKRVDDFVRALADDAVLKDPA